MSAIWSHRNHAGLELAQELAKRRLPLGTLVLALPRGGVPIAAEICQRLKLPMDVLVVRKIGAPEQREFGIGAITEEGFAWIAPDALRHGHATEEDLEQIRLEEHVEVDRRIKLYRQGHELPSLAGKTVVLVDDGLATGVTARVAIRYVKTKGADRVILAVPVCSQAAFQGLSSEEAEIVSLQVPRHLVSVGQFYEDFNQVSDREVIQTLETMHSQSGRWHGVA
jgi:putative phosphoribosyl transferase